MRAPPQETSTPHEERRVGRKCAHLRRQASAPGLPQPDDRPLRSPARPIDSEQLGAPKPRFGHEADIIKLIKWNPGFEPVAMDRWSLGSRRCRKLEKLYRLATSIPIQSRI